MSQFRGGPRYSDDALGYRDAPPRWDAERFTREREIRYNGPTITERERPYEGYGRRIEDRYATSPRRVEPRFEEKFYAEERYGPPARRVDRQYYEEDEIYTSRPPPAGGAMVPFRRPEAPPPPRPGIVRRQSSLDTFDRRAPPRFEEYGPPPAPRYAEPIPPRAPAYAEQRYAGWDYDDREYRYKEREWVTRKRDDSASRDGFEREEFREEVIEEVGEREKPFPRRGKTRMPRRLVEIQVLYDLGYPFHEEGNVIIIEKALGKENIDEVVGLSKSLRERETTTVHLIEAPPTAAPPPEIREEIIEKVETLNINDAPRSVREWDHLSVRSPSPARTSKSHHSHRSRSRKPSRSRSRKPSRSRRGSSPEKHEKIIDVHSDVVTVREVSPSRKSHKSRKSRHSRSSSSSSSSSDSRTQIIERREVVEIDQDESNSIHVGPLALVVQPDRERRKSRSDRDIQAQIRELEEERRKLERERKERDVVKVRRGTIVREVDEEEVEVKKKKAPSAAVMRAMLATLT